MRLVCGRFVWARFLGSVAVALAIGRVASAFSRAIPLFIFVVALEFGGSGGRGGRPGVYETTGPWLVENKTRLASEFSKGATAAQWAQAGRCRSESP